ncbi:hypothetical protein Tco_1376212, partial [Tanacetum coccineum]
ECLLSWTEEDWSSAGYNFSLPLSVAAFLRNFVQNIVLEFAKKEFLVCQNGLTNAETDPQCT